MNYDKLLGGLVNAAAFSGLGLVMLIAGFLLVAKLAPFSVRKEIEEDQNTALAVLMGSVILGLSLIIAAAIHG